MTLETGGTFWNKVRKSEEPDGCWAWTASTVNGYGYAWFEGRSHLAHRVAWLLIHGPIPPKHRVAQSCRNRLCVRPEHLVTGTAAQLAKEWKGGGHRHPRKHARDVLPSDEEIHRIQVLYFHDKRSMASLGREFGLTPRTIDYILKLPMWGELDVNRESAA